MAKRATRELRELDDHDLLRSLEEAKSDLVAVRFNIATHKIENTSRLTQAKRQIARIQTLLTERKREA
jgi:large subunit ribosomal protein L29